MRKGICLLVALFMSLSAWSANAAPVTLQGMGMVSQWTDLETGNGEMPASVWGNSDVLMSDRVGIYVEFANGLTGSATYSGLSGLWNSGFSNKAAVTKTGFFNNAGGDALHGLFNNGVNLPMAWSALAMPFSNNFDLDYNVNQFNSHFRASVSGWQSAVFSTYSSAGPVPVPEPGTLAILCLGFAGLSFARWKRTA